MLHGCMKFTELGTETYQADLEFSLLIMTCLKFVWVFCSHGQQKQGEFDVEAFPSLNEPYTYLKKPE